MLRNYLTVAFRHLRKHRAYALISVGGLAVGMTCALLILFYVVDELRFDRFHPEAERIYRVLEHRDSPDRGTRTAAQSAAALARAVEEQVPGVERATRLFSLWRATMARDDRRFYEGDYLFADPGVFDLFGFELLEGDPATALAEPGSVVLTQSAVRKYFGDENPVGQTLTSNLVQPRAEPGLLTVTGVLRDPPPYSHLAFSMLVADVTLSVLDGWAEADASWTNDFAYTYFRLSEDADPAAVEADLQALTRTHWDADAPGDRRLTIQPLTDVHFGSAAVENDLNRGKGDPASLYILAALAGFLLLIACINYTNLATARALTRTREIGLRKAVGASRGQIARQFLSEGFLVTGAAAVLALTLVQLLLPGFNALAGKALRFDPLLTAITLPALLALVLLLGFGAGGYPALVLSRYRPVRVLKEAPRSGGGRSRLRSALVVLQFALSIGLIAATAVVYAQLGYVQNKSLGFEADRLVAVDINSGASRSQFRTIKAEFARIPTVRSVAVSSRLPGDWKQVTEVLVVPEGRSEGEARTAFFLGIDGDYLDTYRTRLLAGRSFQDDRPADSAAVLLNATAAEAFGWTPEGAVDRRVRLPGAAGDGVDFEARVIGVVEDFHVRSLHETIAPVVLGNWNNPIISIDYFTVRISGADVPATIAALEEAQGAIDPATPFEYNFLEQRLADFYEREARLGRIVALAAGLALLVACLGLFGLAAFTIRRRTKEIGVRKVLGASGLALTLMLSRDFVRLTAIAFVVAAPVAYIAVSRWLDTFAYRIDPGPLPFLAAGGAALLVALLTVGVQAARAVRANPVHALRYE